jgi:predicted choloylglycine hydrolase
MNFTATVVGLFVAFAAGTADSTAEEARFTEAVVAGGANTFMEVRHVRIEGSNFEIGRMLARIAKAAGFQLRPGEDTLRQRVQREYMQENCPILFERMEGIADELGVDVEDDRYDLSSLFFVPGAGPGCSVVFYPAGNTDSGHDILSRNYDFTTGDLQGRRPAEGQPAAMARPYIIELHPDRGYASLAICAFDFLSGVLDGVNSEGLAVAILADDETSSAEGLEATAGVGMHELAAMRYLLDNCKDVPEAKEALLSLKHYYSYIPCHYIIGDSSGRSFIFEFHPQRNRVAIIDGEGPQCITNHLVSNYDSLEELPQGDSYDRYKTLRKTVTASPRFTTEDIIASNMSVAVPPDAAGDSAYAPGRTLWHSLYDLDERSMRVRFYIGEEPDASDSTRVILQYTNYMEFQLAE